MQSLKRENGNKKNHAGARPDRYDFFFYTLLFFGLSFVGWLWEVLIYLVRDGNFVNRGVLTGPWLPIYGAGGILLTLLLGKNERKPWKVFLLSLLSCSALEYLAGWYLEEYWSVRWWDYSGSFCNLNGRICLTGSLLFGAGGLLLVCYAVPFVRNLYRKICTKASGRRAVALAAVILLFLFAADAAWAADFPNMGKDITYPGAVFS